VTSPRPEHDNTVPLGLATIDDLITEIASRCRSLIVGYVRVDVKGKPCSRFHKIGEQLSCLGLAELIRVSVVTTTLNEARQESDSDPRSDEGSDDR